MAKEYKDDHNISFTAIVTVNKDLPDALSFFVPLKAGKDEDYVRVAVSMLKDRSLLSDAEEPCFVHSLLQYCILHDIYCLVEKRLDCNKGDLIA